MAVGGRFEDFCGCLKESDVVVDDYGEGKRERILSNCLAAGWSLPEIEKRNSSTG